MTKSNNIDSKKVDFTSMTSQDIIEHFGNISKSIRSLDQMGYNRSQIAKMLDKRYQHVRNVLVTQLTTK